MTKIEWTDETWNPVHGCTPVSPGCANCYAERMARRLAGRHGYPEAPRHFDVTLRPDRLDEPLRWRKPRMVFVVSMGDLFHEDVPFEFIRQVLDICFEAANHTYQILTKRPDRMREFFDWYTLDHATGERWSLPSNFWLGVTAEDQQRADERIPILLQIPAAVRFVSIEPMLGRVDLWALGDGSWYDAEGATQYDALRGFAWWGGSGDHGLSGGPKLDWVICGGETGIEAREFKTIWALDLMDQCRFSSVPFFMKQLGTHAARSAGKRGKMDDPSEWPDELRVREFPEALR